MLVAPLSAGSIGDTTESGVKTQLSKTRPLAKLAVPMSVGVFTAFRSESTIRQS
jgi:hypothetical protein